MDIDSDSYMSADESDFYSDAENKPVPATKKAIGKTKAPSALKGTKSKASASAGKSRTVFATNSTVANVETNNVVLMEVTKPKSNKTIEEIYQKKTQLEHILLRPDTYIGSVERVTQPMYVLVGEDIIEKEITFTPGLYKIFDEIVVNAADNKQRDPNMDKLDISIDAQANRITVKNNGKGIPIVLHKEHGVYIPTMIFGQLLTGSNFDDNEDKTTGGRNGYGAKLANVFSTEFIVECVDVENGLYFHQVFRDNMSVAEPPTVKNLSAIQKKAGDSVKITFSPDLPRFKMTNLDEDTVNLLSKRAYDMAGSMSNKDGKKLVVSLNDQKLSIKSFKEYLAKFRDVSAPVAYDKSDRWEVGVAASNDAQMSQISFVNSICTSKGGGHVTYIADQVAAHLVKVLKKKSKGGTELKKCQIVNHLTIMVNCLITNPAFDSQTKNFLTTRPKQFGSEFKLSEKFLKAVEKSDIATKILDYASFRQNQALKRKGGVKKVKLTGISKLDDANNAGTAKSKDCTLIITEGDSAKSLAMAGLSVVGRDCYGVFPLRGKPMNVRDAKTAAVVSNEEIKNLVDILGLKFGTVYDESNISTLRYGHLMIMADQDTDGSHIKGLVINFIHNFWPSLLDVPAFLQQFITPIVKVSKGKSTKTFFNIPEYELWLESTGNNGKGYTTKYYKGLGTSTSVEAKEYFSSLDVHEITFDRLCNDKPVADEVDALNNILPDFTQSGSDLIDMVFRKSRVEDRKNWLNNLSKDTFLDYSTLRATGVKYSEFINREYILFSKYDNERSIPSFIDGFKPSQRKVLFGCFKRNLKGEIKVAQLTGYVAEHSAYHHGEQSLQGTIVNMAQNFVGSNNINLLTPSGQFGTRRMGGKDSASARYIFTKLEPITRAIFHPDDAELLTYRTDDGVTIEPEFYVPVIPMVLVNGADGIGTGWSSTVCNYNPREIIGNLRRRIAGEQMIPMSPWYNGFSGEMVQENATKYNVNGIIERKDDTSILISELPVKKWTQDYKEFLETMLVGNADKPADLKDLRENHTESTVSFTLIATKEKIDEFESSKGGLVTKFKLGGSLTTSNMTLFDLHGKIVKFETPIDIMETFFDIRMEFYSKRKDNLIRILEEENKVLGNKARFVEEVCSGKVVVSNRKRQDLLLELQARGYDLIGKQSKPSNEDENESDNDEAEDDAPSIAELAKGYEYLLGMKIWSLTREKVELLRSQLAEKEKVLEELRATPPSVIWLRDLDAIDVLLDDRDVAAKLAEDDELRAKKKNDARQTKKTTKKVVAKKKKKDEWDSDMETDTEMNNIIDEIDSDDDFYGQSTNASRKRSATHASKSKQPAQTADPEDAGLLSQITDSLIVSPPSKKRVSDSSSSLESESLVLATKTLEEAAKKPKKNATVAVNKVSKPRAKPALKKKATKTTDDNEKKVSKSKKIVAKKVSKKNVTDFEDSDSFDFDDDVEVIAPTTSFEKTKRSARSAPVYSFSEDDDSDF